MLVSLQEDITLLALQEDIFQEGVAPLKYKENIPRFDNAKGE